MSMMVLLSDGGGALLALSIFFCVAVVGEGVRSEQRPLRIYRTVVNPNSKPHQVTNIIE